MITNFDSLITEEVISQVVVSQKSENLQRVHAFFKHYLQERSTDKRSNSHIDYIINGEQATHLKNYLSILSVQQNRLIAMYDSGQKPWQDVRDVIGKQTNLELQLRSVLKQQISVSMDSTELPDTLPILSVNINPIENELRKSADRIQILKKHYFKYQELLDQFTENYAQHFRQTEQEITTALDEQLDLESKFTFLLNKFEIKGEIIETKRKLYHELLQIRSLVPGLPLSHYIQLYNPETRINASARVLELMYEE